MSIKLKQIEHFRGKSIVPKYLLQGNLFPATKVIDSAKKERLVKTYERKEIIVHHQGFTQFDLAVSLAYKKIINRHNNFDDINFTMAMLE